MIDEVVTRSATPKYLEIKQRISEDIRAGILGDGACLPGEVELSQHFQASRGTVRSALKALRHDGLIESSQGRKSMVHNIFRSSRPARFLWFGRHAENREEPARIPLYNALLRLVEADRASLTYWMMQGENDDRWLAAHLHEYDGIVIADIGATELMPELARRIRAFGNSVCTQERGDNLARCICHTDDTGLGRLAADFLYRQGFTRIVLLCISPGLRAMSLSRDCGHRFDGFISAFLQMGLGRQYFPTIFSSAESDIADPAALLASLKLRENKIQAIWSMGDACAIKCIDALRRMGFRIPEDISVLGCDGIDAGAHAKVPLTTIGHPYQALAERIYRRLTDGIGREFQPEIVSLPPELIIRESVKLSKSNRSNNEVQL